MDDLSRKFRSIDWKGLQKSARKVQASTASALKDMVMTDLENKTRAATADTSWGASGTDLMQIAQGTYRREDYALIMSIVWQRLASSRWRCVLKALDVLRHLIMHGAARCADEARSALPHLHALQQYSGLDNSGRDVGEGIRRRSKLICDMLADANVLEDERAKSRDLRAKLQGGSDVPGGRLGALSSEDLRRGGMGNEMYSEGYDDGTTRMGTATFKGYGDEDDEVNGTGGYDDVPSGGFAARASASGAGKDGDKATEVQPSVDDLLGGDSPDAATARTHGGRLGMGIDEDEDDDDFDPRGGKPIEATTNVLGDVDVPVGSAAGTRGDVPLSQLVSRLAAEREGGAGALTVATVGGSSGGVGMGMGMGNNEFGGEMGNGMWTKSGANASGGVMGVTGLMAGKEGPSGNTVKSATGPTRVLARESEKEKDPFADLVVTGKKKGVL